MEKRDVIKEGIRYAMKSIRNDLSDESVYNGLHKVIEQIKNNNDFLDADYVGLYSHINNEIDLDELVKMFPKKRFALPKIINNNLEYILIDLNTKYEINQYKIKEPVTGLNITNQIKFIFVPFLAINDEGYRIGYGKGYFDRFFHNKPHIIKVGIGYNFQKTTFEPKKHDIALSYYILGWKDE